MRQHFTSRTGYSRWVTIEDELTVLVGQDGSAFISLPDGYCNERLLTPVQTERAVHNLTQGAVMQYEARICMCCGQMDHFQDGRCAECGSNDLSYESDWPTVRDNEYPTFEELLELRKEGKL